VSAEADTLSSALQERSAKADQRGLSHLIRPDRDRRAGSGGNPYRSAPAHCRRGQQETPILLLDEPTAHLDLVNKRRILTPLRGLAAQGKTVLFTTHDPETALVVADECVLMRAGRILHQGPVADVLTTEKLTRSTRPLCAFSQSSCWTSVQAEIFRLCLHAPDVL